MGKIMAIMGLIMVLMAGAGGLYFKYSQDQLAKLNQAVAKQEVTIEAQKKGIDDLTGRINQVQDAQTAYNRAVNRNRAEAEQKKDQISKITQPSQVSKQPRETEVMINDFTNSMFRDYEAISKNENLAPAKKVK